MVRTRLGFTLIELLIVVAVIGLIAAIAVPALARARMSANEASAVTAMRSIASGQLVFFSTCGNGRYSPSLQNLALGAGSAPGFISVDLGGPAPVIKSGYEHTVSTAAPSALVSCNGGVTGLTFHATAVPQGGRGRRYFGTNGSNGVYESPATLVGVMPDVGSPPPPATPVSSR